MGRVVDLPYGLMRAAVTHKREHPKLHQFLYYVHYLCFPLSQIKALSRPLLSLNRFNILSFYHKDHGARDGGDSEAWIRHLLTQWNITEADGEIVLLTMPRVFGYVFNPVSFWFCLDKKGRLRAVLSEVSNTFGEHHNYLSFHSDKRPITQDEWLRAEKIFHVSPFMDVKGYYLFRFAYHEDHIAVWINYHTEDGRMLSTSLVGKRGPLTSMSLISSYIMLPFVAFKVIFLIHFEALRLWLKGMRYRKKTLPPTVETST